MRALIELERVKFPLVFVDTVITVRVDRKAITNDEGVDREEG